MPDSYPAPAPIRNHIVLYQDAHCGGTSTQLFGSVISLVFVGWNDAVSSIVVVAGSWQCYKTTTSTFRLVPC